VAVNGNLSAGISSLLLEAAVAGCGIAMLPELEARSAIASGALEVVLPDWTPKALSVYGIYLSRDYQPDGLPLFLDALQRRLGDAAGAEHGAASAAAPAGGGPAGELTMTYSLPH
jgi:DNA-binding transcriptional LysR family regulator